MTENLLKSPGLFSVVWLSSIMLSFGWSPLVRQLPNPPGPFIILSKVPITIGTIVTFMFHSFFNSLARSRYLAFFSHSFSFILLLLLLLGLFQVHQLLLVSWSFSYYTAFLFFLQNLSTCLIVFFNFYSVVRWDGKILFFTASSLFIHL